MKITIELNGIDNEDIDTLKKEIKHATSIRVSVGKPINESGVARVYQFGSESFRLVGSEEED
jgi:HKD family nuclease